MAILMLQEQGKLKITDPVCVHIPDCPESWQAMTIHHLLTHKAGLYDFRDFVVTGAARPTPSSASDVVAHVSAKPLAFAPGTGWAYSNGNYMVAGYIVEQVSGQPYEVFLHDHIFAPAGMVNTGYAGYDSGLAVGYEDGYDPAPQHDASLPYAAAGVYSTVEDLYRYLQALEQATLLSQPSLDALFGAHDRVDSKGGFTPAYQVPVYYGYGWAIASYNGHPMLGHDGWIEGYSADMRYFPDDGLKILLLMNRNDPYAPTIGDEIVGMLLPGKAAVAAAAPTTSAPATAIPATSVPEPGMAADGNLNWTASVDEQIASVLSAAPLAIAQDATIKGNPPNKDSKDLPVLRQGTNDWTCYPDFPDSPGASPSCNNSGWEAFWNAVTPEKRPEITQFGLSYMLMGGADASTTDPNVMQPPAGQDWIMTPSHLMIVTPGDLAARRISRPITRRAGRTLCGKEQPSST